MKEKIHGLPISGPDPMSVEISIFDSVVVDESVSETISTPVAFVAIIDTFLS